jgi:hypothetical protein
MPQVSTGDGDEYVAGRRQVFITGDVPGEAATDPPEDDADDDAPPDDDTSAPWPGVTQNVRAGRNATVFGRDGVVIRYRND